MGQAGRPWQTGWGCGLVQVWRADMGHGTSHSLLPVSLALFSGWVRHGVCLPFLCSLPQSSFTLPATALLPFLQIPTPRAPSFPHPSVVGNFPIFTPSNGPGHSESCLGDVLTSPSPTSLARLVLVMHHQGSNCHPCELPEPQAPFPASHRSLCSRGRAAGGTQRWHSEVPMGTLTSSCHQSPVPSPVAGTRVTRVIGWSASIR